MKLALMSGNHFFYIFEVVKALKINRIFLISHFQPGKI